MQFDENAKLIVPDDYKLTVTLAYDKKSGIQAISNTTPGLSPRVKMGKYIVTQNTNVLLKLGTKFPKILLWSVASG